MRGPKFAHRATLWGVWVDPPHRGQGLGQLVVESALQWARQLAGVDYVDLSVSENAPEALRLHERLGFRAWGHEPASTQHGTQRYDEIYMALRL